MMVQKQMRQLIRLMADWIPGDQHSCLDSVLSDELQFSFKRSTVKHFHLKSSMIM